MNIFSNRNRWLSYYKRVLTETFYTADIEDWFCISVKYTKGLFSYSLRPAGSNCPVNPVNDAAFLKVTSNLRWYRTSLLNLIYLNKLQIMENCGILVFLMGFRYDYRRLKSRWMRSIIRISERLEAIPHAAELLFKPFGTHFSKIENMATFNK